MIVESTQEIATLAQLRAFVLKTVCEAQQLLPGTVRMAEQILSRHNKACGMQFTLNGPRAVQFSAIWETDRHTLLFYDSNGVRFQRCELSTTVKLERELADLAGT